MLEHVVKAEILNLVLCGVDTLVRELEGGFNDKGRGVAVAAGRGMIRAGIATLGQNIGDVAVLSNC